MDLLNLLIESSVGKKILMAVTGLCMTAFLAVHLVGNLTAFAGADAFNGYADKLHSLGPILVLFNTGLATIAVIHMVFGFILFFENRRARSERYLVYKNPGGRTIGSDTMPYSGLLILVFVIYHLFKFTFVDKSDTTIYSLVSATFSNPIQVIFYSVAMVVVAFHISHGLWSLFHTLGMNSQSAMPLLYRVSRLSAVIFGIGFGSLPIYLLMAP